MKTRSRKRVKQPAAKAPNAEARLTKAYESLGVDPQKVIDTPKITHILSRIPGKRGHAGIKAAIEFLRGADNEEIRKFLSLWDDMPESFRALLPFEAFCVATNITTKRMLEIVTGACFEQSDVAVKLVAAAAHPEVVTATVKAALYHDGFQDRKMLHLNKGFLPVNKNQTTFLAPGATQNNLQLNDNSQHTTYAIGEIAGIEKRQERIADRFNERLGLGSSRPVERISQPSVEPEPDQPEPIEAELVDDWSN